MASYNGLERRLVMETNKLFFPLLVLGMLVAFSSCKEDSDDVWEEESVEKAPSEMKKDVFYHCNIASANDLLSFAQRVNSGEKNLNARLVSDVDASKIKWSPITPISEGTKAVPAFSGVFNGNGYTISGLKFDDESQNNVALFGAVAPSGIIKDLKMANISFNAGDGVAAICVSSQGTIENCEVLSGQITGSADVAGVCARNYGVLLNCVNGATVQGEVAVGGLTANNSMGLLDGCENKGEVVGMKEAIVGGLAAINNNYIINCKNSGKVRNGFSKEGTGGICAQNYAFVMNCFNSGMIEGGISGIGGICGKLLGETQAVVKNCISTGGVNPLKRDNAGAMLGWLSGEVEVNTCYYTSETTMLVDGLGEPANMATMCTTIRPNMNNWIKEEGKLDVEIQSGHKTAVLKPWKVVDRELSF